ncbi:MAG: hypothetical protein ACUVS6_13710 [Anaerolineae bacterium]
MAVNQLDILIRVNGAAQARAALQSVTGAAQQLGLMLGAGGAAAGMVAFGRQAFLMAGQAERLGRATDQLARSLGASGQAMVAAITDASQHTISSLDAMRLANKAMLLDVVKNEDEMRDLARIAIVLGQAMGKDATSAVDDLTTALGRQSPLILDNLGIKMNLTEAEERYAQSLGKTVEQLTDAEKRQAFLNAAWEKAREKAEQLGTMHIDTIGQLEQLTAAWADFQTEFGQFLTGSGVIEQITNLVVQLKEGARAWQGVFSAGRAGQETGKAQTLAIAATALAASPPGLIASAVLGKSVEETAASIAQFAQQLGLVSFDTQKLQQELHTAAAAEQAQSTATRSVAETAAQAADVQRDYAGALKAAGELARRLANLEQQYHRDRENTILQFNQRRARAEEDFARSQAEQQQDFQRQQQRLMRDFLRSQAEAEAEYYRQRGELAERYGVEQARAEEEHQRHMARMHEDYIMRQEDAVAARDALAFLRNAREYEINRRRAEEDFAAQRAARQADYQRQLEDLQQAFAQQREQRLAQFQQQQQDLQSEFEYRRARAAEYHRLEMQQLDADYRARLTELQVQLDEQRAIERQAFQERLMELRGFNNDFLALEQQRNAAAKQILEETLQEMRQQRAMVTYQPVHGRASGGYAGYGIYRLGEVGREFVLNAAATRSAEVLSGGPLSQERVLALLAAGHAAGRSAVQFNQTVHIGGQERYDGLLAAIRAQTIALLSEYARS